MVEILGELLLGNLEVLEFCFPVYWSAAPALRTPIMLDGLFHVFHKESALVLEFLLNRVTLKTLVDGR